MPKYTSKTKRKKKKERKNKKSTDSQNSTQTAKLKPNQTIFDRTYSNLTSFLLIKKY